MNKIFSTTVQSIEISGIRKFYNKVVNYPQAISLTLGQPDFSVPKKIKESMMKAIEDDKTTYTSNAGIIELRKEICSYLTNNDIKFNPEEICITVGGSEALMSVFTAFINPRDKVLIPTPAYPAYESCVKLLGGKVENYKLNKDFSIDFSYLENCIENLKPKLMVISYPSNPTGSILSKRDRDKLHEIIKKNGIIVITDEIYSSLCYEDYYSICQHEDIKDKIIMINGFSKMFSMTGLRVGYVCAIKKHMNQIMKVHQYGVSCAPSISQWGAYEGLKYCIKDVENMKQQFKDRRDYVYNRLKDIGFDVTLPKGAFYIFPSIEKFNMKSEEFCDRLLKEAGVAAVPGSAFGKGGEGYIRISYSYSLEQITEALNRIETWIEKNQF